MQSALFHPSVIAWLALSLCLLLSPLQAQDLHITLPNGDCDGDNEVTLFDFGIVVNAFGSTPNDPNRDPRADLDGDCEVTLFDYGIVVRNFGAIGAEPFDPALPREPAPSEGYALPGFIELEDWLGPSQPVRIEALREDDPDQIVYWMEAQSAEPFTLHLPQSGLWWVKVSGMPCALTAQRSAKKTYSKGDAVQVIIVYPSKKVLPDGTVQYEKFGDSSVDSKTIAIHVHAFDYDKVTYTSADGSVQLENKEREKPSRLRATWDVFQGEGSINMPDPLRFDAVYIPPSDPPQDEDYEYREDTKTRTFPLCFAKTDHDEWNDTSRGESFYFGADPPNWFDAKPGHDGHWGRVIDRFNETDGALAGGYIVYYMPDRPPNDDDLRKARAVFDWAGKYAPPGHDYEVSYRGRIYLIGAPIIACTDSQLGSSQHGVLAGGIDRVGITLVHESAHRDLWLAPGNWEGFTPDKIGGPAHRGGPGYFFPGNPLAKTGLPTDIFYDKDGDKVRDRYERSAEGRTYHFLAPPDDDKPVKDINLYAFAVERWWTGDQTAKSRKDVEAHAQLWGEWGKEGTWWKGYKVGSKDTQDWSVGGRQNY